MCQVIQLSIFRCFMLLTARFCSHYSVHPVGKKQRELCLLICKRGGLFVHDPRTRNFLLVACVWLYDYSSLLYQCRNTLESVCQALSFGFVIIENVKILICLFPSREFYTDHSHLYEYAVLEVGDGVFEVLSTSGDTHLGGDDFDKVLWPSAAAELIFRSFVC